MNSREDALAKVQDGIEKRLSDYEAWVDRLENKARAVRVKDEGRHRVHR